jgi:ribosome-associated protein
LDSLELTNLIIRALQARKAIDPVILDLRGLTIIADVFIIVTANSTPHINALVDGVLEAAKGQGVRNIRREGVGDSAWVLLDLGAVIVHIFTADQRDFYKLERLWADAEQLPVTEDTGA